MSKPFRVMLAVGLIAVMLTAWNVASVWAATPPEPIYGTATVDGNPNEWASDPLFADMIKASGHGGQTEVLSKLYLRYDCSSGTLYALVLVESGHYINTYCGDGEHWIKLGDNKLVDCNDSEFAWVGQNGSQAQGWEASASLVAGSYNNLHVHTIVDAEKDTSGTHYSGTDLEINCPGLGSIGDYVWNDVNRDGIQDGGESGINGVVVQLYEDEDGDGVIDPEDDLLQTTTTANAPVTGEPGWYIFTGLAAGNYIVKVADSNFDSGGTLYDYLPAVPNAGSDDTVDSDGDPVTHEAAVTLASGENNMTIDFGFSDCEIGDRVWHDQNGDGKQELDLGEDWDYEGLNGVDVYLYGSQPSTCSEAGYLYKTTTISGTSRTPDGYPDGIYGFDMTGLAVNQYYWVCVDESTLPQNHPSAPHGWTATTSNPQKVYYMGGDDFSIDFGYEPSGPPTAVTLSSFAARPSAGGWANPLWLGFAGLTVLAAGSLFWAKRRSR